MTRANKGGHRVGRAVLLTALLLACVLPWARGAGGAGAASRHDLLTRADLPAGWSTSPTARPGAGVPVPPRAVAACAGIAARTIPRHAPEATAPEFDQAADQRSVNEEVVTYRSAAAARAAFGALASSRTPACATAYLDRSAAHREDYSATRLVLEVPRARSCGLAISLPVSQGTATVDDYVDEVELEVGATDATLTLTSFGSAFPLSLADQVAQGAARRLR